MPMESIAASGCWSVAGDRVRYTSLVA